MINSEPSMTLAMLSRPALPADFKSVYRLFLRASASATLHSGRGTRTLRQHWRPVFEEAAIKLCRLYDPSCQEEHPQLRGWMNDWDRKSEFARKSNLTASDCSLISRQYLILIVQLFA